MKLTQIVIPLAMAAKAMAHGEEAESSGYKAPIKFTEDGLSNVLKVGAKDPSGDAESAIAQVTAFLQRNPKIKSSVVSVISDPKNAKAVSKGQTLASQILSSSTSSGINIYKAKIKILQFAYENKDFFELAQSVAMKVIKDNPTLLDDFFAALGRIVKANPEMFAVLRQSLMDFSHEDEKAYKMGFELVLKASLSNVDFSSYALIHILKLDKIACGLMGSGSKPESCECEAKDPASSMGEMAPTDSSHATEDPAQVSEGAVAPETPATPEAADPMSSDSMVPAPGAEGEVTSKEPAVPEPAAQQSSYSTQPTPEAATPQSEGQVENEEDCDEEEVEEDCEDEDDTSVPSTEPVVEPAVDTPAAETPAAEGSTETPAVETPQSYEPEAPVETPAAETPAAEESTETPAAETPAAEGSTETPVAETPAAEGSTETPAVETPVAEESTETPAAETPAAEGSTETPAVETPAAEGATETSGPSSYNVEESQPEESQVQQPEAPVEEEVDQPELEEDLPEAEGNTSEPEPAEPQPEEIQEPSYSRPESSYAVDEPPTSEGSTEEQVPEAIEEKPKGQDTYAVKAPKPAAYTI